MAIACISLPRHYLLTIQVRHTHLSYLQRTPHILKKAPQKVRGVAKLAPTCAEEEDEELEKERSGS